MVPDSAVCIYPEEVSSSRQPLKHLMTSSSLTLNIPFSLSTSRKPFLSTWGRMGFSPKPRSPECFYLSLLLGVLTDPCPQRPQYPLPGCPRGAHKVSDYSLTSWLVFEHPPTGPHQPYITSLKGWGLSLCFLPQPWDTQDLPRLSLAGLWDGAGAPQPGR